MRLPIYQVDAFTDTLFGGNPAAVCPLQAWLPDATMQAIAAENNLSETAFFVREAGDYALRWFTPSVEVDLCGHATLASAHVVFSFLEPARERVRFRTLKAGTLEVSRRSGPDHGLPGATGVALRGTGGLASGFGRDAARGPARPRSSRGLW
jgi:PhzF family phenazine biosynthesis protein